MVPGLVTCSGYSSCMVNCNRYGCTCGPYRKSHGVSLPLAGVLLASAVTRAWWAYAWSARTHNPYGTTLDTRAFHRNAAVVRMGGRCPAPTRAYACVDTGRR